MEKILSKAITLALKAHEGQVDKSGMPYAGHIMRVMAAGRTMDEKIVGVLHDVVEDTEWTFEALLKEGFPVHIVDALRCVTKLSDDEPYDEFIERVKTNPLAVAVKINDLADNMDIRRYKELSDWDVKRLKKYLKAYQELTNQQKQPNCVKITHFIWRIQKLYEAILEVKFDRRNFYNKMLKLGILSEAEPRPANATNRTPNKYRFNAEKYAELKQKGFRLEF